MTDIKIRGFSKRNLLRCEAENGFGHSINAWSLSDWMTALTGEVGEAANIIKKLNRHRDGTRGNSGNDTDRAFLQTNLGDELADIYIYLDLLATAANIDLAQAISNKFEVTSQKIGYEEAAT